MKILLRLFIVFIFCNCEIKGANILAIFTVPSRSHSILGFELFKELVKSGHKITVISPEGNELKNPPENYTNIVIGGELISLAEKKMNNAFEEVDMNPLILFKDMLNLTAEATKYLINQPNVQKLIHSSITFDLIISELALNEAILGFSEYYKCPHILISTVGATSWVETITSNPSPYSYIPHVFLDFTDKMSIFERLQNTLFHLSESIFMSLFHYNRHREIYENSFPNSKNFRPFWDKIKHGVSVVLLNSHFSLSFPRPYLPNVIEVGGMHIKKEISPLPEDIKKFIDDSEYVVYFSLGGNLKPSVMPVEKQQAIINSLTKINARILWKWDDENVNIDRKKFLVKKWFPQDDILAHSKVKIFITHGGLLGGSEAIYYSKPLIVIPIFGDQKLNAARSVAAGFGIRVDYSNLTEESLSWALKEMMTNDKYNLKAMELSKRFRDRQNHPLDTAKYYVEYVLRNKGATFLQSSATRLNFIELYNLDVIFIIVLAVFILLYIPYALIKKIFSVLFGNETKTVKKLKKK